MSEVGAGGAHPPPPPEMTCRFLIQLVFCKKKLCGLLEETSAPPPKKNPGSAPGCSHFITKILPTKTNSDFFVLHVPTKTRHFIRPKS